MARFGTFCMLAMCLGLLPQPHRAKVGMEFPCEKVIVDSLACPCVDGGILLLAVGQFLCLPVGQTLVFGNPVVEDYAVNLLQAVVGYIVILYECL